MKLFSFKRLAGAGIALTASALLAGCSILGGSSVHQAQGTEAPAAPAVNVMKIQKQSIGDPLEFAAEVESSAQFQLNAEASGTVEKLFKQRGDFVKAGDAIVQIRSTDLEQRKRDGSLALQKAQSDLSRAKSENRVELAKMNEAVAAASRNYNKMRNDYDKGLVSRSELDEAQKQLSSSQADLKVLRQQSASNEESLSLAVQDAKQALQDIDDMNSTLVVKSPANGVLSQLSVEEGATVMSGYSIGLVEKLDPVKVSSFIPTEALPFVKGKTKLAYYTQDQSQAKTGTISYLANLIDPETREYEINMDIPNADYSLQPGMQVRVQLTSAADQVVLAVPTRSVRTEGGESYVFAIQNDRVVKRAVKLGRVSEPLQEVLSGLRENDLVVVSGPGNLRDQDAVKWTLVQNQ